MALAQLEFLDVVYRRTCKIKCLLFLKYQMFKLDTNKTFKLIKTKKVWKRMI